MVSKSMIHINWCKNNSHEYARVCGMYAIWYFDRNLLKLMHFRVHSIEKFRKYFILLCIILISIALHQFCISSVNRIFLIDSFKFRLNFSSSYCIDNTYIDSHVLFCFFVHKMKCCACWESVLFSFTFRLPKFVRLHFRIMLWDRVFSSVFIFVISKHKSEWSAFRKSALYMLCCLRIACILPFTSLFTNYLQHFTLDGNVDGFLAELLAIKWPELCIVATLQFVPLEWNGLRK